MYTCSWNTAQHIDNNGHDIVRIHSLQTDDNDVAYLTCLNGIENGDVRDEGSSAD